MNSVIFRCDKNGDGRLSEDEVKEVSTKDHSFLSLIFFHSLPPHYGNTVLNVLV